MGGDRVAWREHRVSRACPCPVCGKDKPCLAFPSPLQPREVVCSRVASEDWVEGLQGWRHHLEPGQQAHSPAAPLAPRKREIPKAAPELLDEVWNRARELSNPLDGRRHLPLFMNARRGMTATQVKARGYFPWLDLADRYAEGYRREGDSRWLLPARLVAEFGEKLYQVPGFGQRIKDGQPWAAGWSGIFLPCRDPLGSIVGGQVMPFEAIRRKHGAPKYATLSAGKLIGAEAGHLLHCARPTGFGATSDASRVWLTEGLLKADIAADLLGETVLGAAGQKFEEEALADYLRALQPSEVVIALDYDAPESSAAAKTEKVRKTLGDQLLELGYQVSIACWKPEQGKGLDDLLLAGERPVLREYLGRRRRPRLAGPVLEEMETAAKASRPVVSVEEQRAQYADTLRDYLANRNGISAEEVLLVRLAPGIGKTTTFEAVAREYVAKDAMRSLVHFVPTHQVGQQEGADQAWHQVYGRTSDKAPHGRPCHEPDKARALAERGETNGEICRLCALKSACEGSARSPEAPYYLGQFRRRQLTRLPAAHLLSPDLVGRCGGGPLVIDDVDLDGLQLSSSWVTEQDLVENLFRAKGEPDPEDDPYSPILLRPAVNLLEVLRDFRRYLTDTVVSGQEYPQGAELVKRLNQWCAENGRDLRGSIASALTANEYDPLAGVRTLDQLDLDTLGARPVALKLARVLSAEVERLDEGAESWNSRLACGHPPGPSSAQHGVSLQIWEQRSLPLEAYRSRPIVILNASMTAEQAERLFPGRRIRVLEPRAPLPEGVKVTQYLDRNYGKTVLERDEKAQEKALAEVRAIVERHRGQKVGVITHKGFAERLKSELPELTVMNFFNHRSQNAAADVNAWVVLGTPHPNESAMARATEALHWRDPRPLDHSIGYREQEIEDVDGLRYKVSRRTARDSRLQEQLEQRTALELEQALFRCRPHNLEAPEQGDLFRPLAKSQRRISLDIYVFGQTPLGLPVNVVTERAARKPALLDQVVEAARKLVRDGRSPTQRALETVLREAGLSVTYRGVIEALRWLRQEYGEDWLEVLSTEDTPPRAACERDLEGPAHDDEPPHLFFEKNPGEVSTPSPARRDDVREGPPPPPVKKPPVKVTPHFPSIESRSVKPDISIARSERARVELMALPRAPAG